MTGGLGLNFEGSALEFGILLATGTRYGLIERWLSVPSKGFLDRAFCGPNPPKCGVRVGAPTKGCGYLSLEVTFDEAIA